MNVNENRWSRQKNAVSVSGDALDSAAERLDEAEGQVVLLVDTVPSRGRNAAGRLRTVLVPGQEGVDRFVGKVVLQEPAPPVLRAARPRRCGFRTRVRRERPGHEHLLDGAVGGSGHVRVREDLLYVRQSVVVLAVVEGADAGHWVSGADEEQRQKR